MEPKTANNIAGTVIALIAIAIAFKAGKKTGYQDALKDAIRLLDYAESSQK